MNVLFLDIDGVLNTERSRDRFGPSEIDPGRVALVDGVCARTGVVLVISSDWRLPQNDGLEATVAALRRAGLRAEVVGGTPLEVEARIGVTSREAEILAWLEQHPEARTFAVLDDVAMRGEVLAPRSVLTTDRWGLTVELALRLEALLA